MGGRYLFFFLVGIAACLLVQVLPVNVHGVQYPHAGKTFQIKNHSGIPVRVTVLRTLDEKLFYNVRDIHCKDMMSKYNRSSTTIACAPVLLADWDSSGPLAFHLNGAIYLRYRTAQISTEKELRRLIAHETAHYI